jgi:hypothetical protein
MVIEKDPIEHRSKGKIAVLRTKNGFFDSISLRRHRVKFMAIQLDGQSLNDSGINENRYIVLVVEILSSTVCKTKLTHLK